MDKKLNYLQMLQAVISRMAGNSFLLKGWSVTLVSALFALAADKANINFIFLSYFPVLMFWALDGYFLRQERLFRALYDHVRSLPDDQMDFSMDTQPVAANIATWLSVCFSVTLRLFHGIIFLSVVVVMLVILLGRH
jgi:hypothetical protein